MLEYDVYAHVDGVDYQICGLPIVLRWTEDFDINNVLLIVTCNNSTLQQDTHFTLTYDYNARCATLTFNVTASSCRVVCQNIQTLDTKQLPRFDVVRKVTIQRDEDCMVHAALAKIIRQNEDTHQRTQLLMIMYQKLCQLLVNAESENDRKRKRQQ